jgi:hypothetical protein
MDSLTTFMNSMSIKELDHFKAIEISGKQTSVSANIKDFNQALIHFSPILENKLQTEVISVLYAKISLGSNLHPEIQHYLNIINFHNIIKAYLCSLSVAKLVESPELNAMLDCQPPLLTGLIELLANLKIHTNFNPHSEFYVDFDDYSRQLLVIVESLINDILAKYSAESAPNICVLPFSKRIKVLIMSYNIIMIIFYLLIRYTA